MPHSPLKAKIHELLKDSGAKDMEISDGPGDNVHVAILNRQLSSRAVRKRNDHISSILLNGLSADEWSRVSIQLPAKSFFARYKWLLALCLAVAVGAFAYDMYHTISWVGSADLAVEFVVTDGITALPVEAAEIEIVVRKAQFYRYKDEPLEFILTPNADGIARHVCK